MPDRRAVLAAAVLALGLGAGPAAAIQVTEFALPSTGGSPLGIAAGPDGQMWFTEVSGSRFGVVSAAGVVNDFSSGSGISPGSEPWGIAAGSDGAMWYTDQANARIGRIDVTARTATEFTTGISPSSGPRGIAAGPDGNLWFAEDAGRIGRITTTGTVTEFTTGITAGSRPLGIAAGPDGNLWFTQLNQGVARITTAGVVTEFTAGIAPSALPQGIAAGPDGNLWFVQLAAGVARITTAGVVTQFPVTAASQPRSIAAGPDGAMWFTEENGRRIGRVTMAGVVTEFPVTLQAGGTATEIAAGPGRQLWITTGSGNRVARVRLPPAVTTGDAAPAPGAAAVAGTVDPFASDASWSVQYGPTTAYGSVTPARLLPAGPAPVAVGATITGLGSGGTAHYRVVATSEGGTTFGADRTVTALPVAGGRGGGGPQRDRSAPRAAIGPGPLVLTGSGRVSVRVTCPLAETLGCRGRVRLATSGRHRTGAGRAAALRVVPLGSAAWIAGGGQSRFVRVRVPAAGRALVRRLGGLRARAVVTAHDTSGNTGTTTRTLGLRPAARGGTR